MSEHVDLQEFLAGYLAEADEHLASVRSNLLAADEASGRGEAAPRAVRELFRSLHTIKGLSGMVGVEPVVEIAHAMEAVLRTADRAGGRLPPGSTDVLARGAGEIESRVRALGNGQPVRAAPPGLLETIAAIHPEGAGSRPAAARGVKLPPDLAERLAPGELTQIGDALLSGRRVVRLDFVPSPERAERGVNITSVREAVSRVGEIVKVVPLSVPRSEGAPGGLHFVLLVVSEAPVDELARAAEVPPENVVTLEGANASGEQELLDDAGELEPEEIGERRASAGVVRVEVSRLDEALEQLSGLVVSRYRMERAASALTMSGADTRPLRESLEETSRQLRDLRAAIMRARMVRVAEALDRVPLLVRGMSRATGKAVRLELDAGRAEVDKAVADRLFPAVIHLVRNAIDHAIEPPEERHSAGKPEEGRITVTCFERSDSQLELVVADDGRGIDRRAVARRAGRPVPRTDAELLDLLALPGLTTRDEVSATSGRGYGVDIARRIAVHQLGGELHLTTREGRGSRFTLRVPLSLTIIEALSLVCAEEPFVVPVTVVEEIVEVEAAGMVRAPVVGGAGPAVGLFRRRGEAMPMVSLDEALGTRTGGEALRPKALVIRTGGQPFAFGVDRLVGQQEVVVRPLEDPLVRVPGVTGSTDLGDGRPTLVLDLAALAARVSAGEARAG